MNALVLPLHARIAGLLSSCSPARAAISLAMTLAHAAIPSLHPADCDCAPHPPNPPAARQALADAALADALVRIR